MINEPTQWHRDLTKAMLLDDPKLWLSLWNRAPVSPIIRAVVNRLDRGQGYFVGSQQHEYTKIVMQNMPNANMHTLWDRYDNWLRQVMRYTQQPSYAKMTISWLDQCKQELSNYGDTFAAQEAACAMETAAAWLQKNSPSGDGWRTLRNKLLALLKDVDQ